jgi:tetrahydromethanopterin S-methyltransferase subunit A
MSTLRDEDLAETIANIKPHGLSIVGKTHTENIGIEKIIKNLLFVPSIKYLIICGNESGHYSGDTLKALFQNGVDMNMRVIGTKAKRPILINITSNEVETFRKQVKIVDMIDCCDLNSILDKVDQLSQNSMSEYNDSCLIEADKVTVATEVILAEEKDPKAVKLDKAGYFVIVPKGNSIFVEHYSNDNRRLHIVKGENARNIYWTIIENGWVTELSHAAYLGKELTKAEISIQQRVKYVQDMA